MFVRSIRCKKCEKQEHNLAETPITRRLQYFWIKFKKSTLRICLPYTFYFYVCVCLSVLYNQTPSVSFTQKNPPNTRNYITFDGTWNYSWDSVVMRLSNISQFYIDAGSRGDGELSDDGVRLSFAILRIESLALSTFRFREKRNFELNGK